MISNFHKLAILMATASAQKGSTGDILSGAQTSLGLDTWTFGGASAAEPTTDDYIYSLDFYSGADFNSGSDQNAMKTVEFGTIDASGVVNEASVLAEWSGSTASLDLSGDPVGCIRSVELFTNSYETGGRRSRTFTWVSGMSMTDSTGAVTSFGTTASSVGSVNFGNNGCLVSLTPVQDGNGEVQGIAMYSKESTTLFTTPVTTNTGSSGSDNDSNSEGGFTIPEWATEKPAIVGAVAVLGLIILTGVYCSIRVKQPHETASVSDVSAKKK